MCLKLRMDGLERYNESDMHSLKYYQEDISIDFCLTAPRDLGNYYLCLRVRNFQAIKNVLS